MNSDPDTLLEGIATVVVPNETCRGFAATDFPSIIAIDYNGVICWNQNIYTIPIGQSAMPIGLPRKSSLLGGQIE